MFKIGVRAKDFLPQYIFSKLTDITPEFLNNFNIRLLLMDFDNTMLPYTTDEPTKELLNWMELMQQSGIRLCIVSNSKKARVPTFSMKYGIPCVTHARKPGTKGIRQAIAEAGEIHAALVGDQIFTDVLGANLARIPSIIVPSIHNHNFWLKLRHVFELPFLAIAKNRKITSSIHTGE